MTNDTTRKIHKALSNIAIRPAGYGFLGKSDGSGVIVADLSKRTLWVQANANQPPVGTPLLDSINILPYIGVHPELEGLHVSLGYPPSRPTVLHVTGFDQGEGLQSVGGITPTEQMISSQRYTDVGGIVNFRLSPNNPVDSEVYINAGWYMDVDGSPAAWGGDSTDTLLTTAIAALSAGQHQMAVPYIDTTAGIPGIVTNTPSAGGVNDKQLFDTTTIMEMTHIAGEVLSGAVHLYYGQTTITEDDIYRSSDPRSIFNATGTGGEGSAPADATYLIKTANASLPNAQAMGALATGIVYNTTGTGTQSIAVAGTNYTSPAGAENLSNKTITLSSIVATALSLLIGGFKAIFTHANTADRTYTLPNYDGQLATLAGTETLSAKTLTAPTIADYTNAQHPHTNPAGGGQITDAALSSFVGVAKGGSGANMSGTGGANFLLKQTGVGAAFTSALMVLADIPNALITGAKIASNTIEFDRIVTGTPFAGLAYDIDGALQADTYMFQYQPAQWGEAVDPLDLITLNPSDNKWYKADVTAGAFVMYARRGVVLPNGVYGINQTGIAVIRGILGGYSGLTAGSWRYASSTPGISTGTEPSPSLGGNEIASIPWGWSGDSTTLIIDPMNNPVRYMKRLSLADLATTTLVHHADMTLSTRKAYAAVSSNDIAIVETSGGAQDSSRQLRGQSGAGSTNTVTSTDSNGTALGDNGGTDFRLGQSFQVTAAGQLSSIVVRAGATTGTPSTATVPYRVETDAAGIPSGTVLASGSTPTWVASADNTITITNGPFLVTGTTYWFVLELATMQSTNNFYTVMRNAAGAYASGLMKWDSTTGASFPNTWAGGAGTNDMRVAITVAAVVLNDGLAQGFSHASTTTASYVDLLLKRTGTLSGNLTCAIYSSTAGLPNAVITNGTSTTRLASDVTTGYTLIRFTWPTPPTITASTQYHLVLTTSDSASNTAWIEWGIDISSPPYANGALALLNPTWSAASPAADGLFDLYGATTAFNTMDAAGFWFSIKNDIVSRFDNGSGSNPTTNTTFKNTSGATLDVTCIVEMP